MGFDTSRTAPCSDITMEIVGPFVTYMMSTLIVFVGECFELDYPQLLSILHKYTRSQQKSTSLNAVIALRLQDLSLLRFVHEHLRRG